MCNVAIILCGIPTSGKSTFRKKMIAWTPGMKSLCRDDLRLECFKLKRLIDYKYTNQNEKIVTEVYNSRLDYYISQNLSIILDNTHCKEKYLQEALRKFNGTNYDVYIQFFDLPLWKAYLRNIKRYFQTGVILPPKVIKDMYNNYKKISKAKYI